MSEEQKEEDLLAHLQRDVYCQLDVRGPPEDLTPAGLWASVGMSAVCCLLPAACCLLSAVCCLCSLLSAVHLPVSGPLSVASLPVHRLPSVARSFLPALLRCSPPACLPLLCPSSLFLCCLISTGASTLVSPSLLPSQTPVCPQCRCVCIAGHPSRQHHGP